jgi:hypothetical protein
VSELSDRKESLLKELAEINQVIQQLIGISTDINQAFRPMPSMESNSTMFPAPPSMPDMQDQSYSYMPVGSTIDPFSSDEYLESLRQEVQELSENQSS